MRSVANQKPCIKIGTYCVHKKSPGIFVNNLKMLTLEVEGVEGFLATPSTGLRSIDPKLGSKLLAMTSRSQSDDLVNKSV
jgi:hypothetical protein